MRESKERKMKYGVTQWEQFNEDDEESYPPYCEEIMLALLTKEGKPRIVKTAMFGFGKVFYEILGTRKLKGSSGLNEITKRRTLNKDDYQDISWCEVTVPDWWHEKGEE